MKLFISIGLQILAARAEITCSTKKVEGKTVSGWGDIYNDGGWKYWSQFNGAYALKWCNKNENCAGMTLKPSGGRMYWFPIRKIVESEWIDVSDAIVTWRECRETPAEAPTEAPAEVPEDLCTSEPCNKESCSDRFNSIRCSDGVEQRFSTWDLDTVFSTGECEELDAWTSWFNRDGPMLGDYENNAKYLVAGYNTCSDPVAMQVRIHDPIGHNLPAKFVTHITSHHTFSCVSSENYMSVLGNEVDRKGKYNCPDFEVRLCCSQNNDAPTSK